MALTRDPLHVLQVTAAPGAGVLRHVLDLTEGCLAAGLRITLAVPHHRVTELGALRRIKDLQMRGARVESFGLEPTIRPRGYVRAALRIREFITQHDVPVVHLHSSRAGALLRLLPVLPRGRCRVLYTPHAFSFLRASSPVSRLVLTQLERMAGRLRTDVVVAVSESERELALQQRVVRDDQIQVIRNGIDSGTLGRQCTASTRETGSCIRILSLGRLSWQKNPLFFVDVAERMCGLRQDIAFRWGGDGELLEKVRARLRGSTYRDRISFLGHVEDVESELRAAAVYFSTSRYEGLPYSIVEALAHALPVVASNVVGNRDVAIDCRNGRLYTPGDTEAAVACIAWVLAEPSRRASLGGESYAIAVERHSLRNMIEQHVTLYRKLHSDFSSAKLQLNPGPARARKSP